MKKLIISPQAGLGNRLRAMCSAKVLGDLLGREVYHHWVPDPVLSHLDIEHVNWMKRIDPSYMFDFGIPKWTGGAPSICFSEFNPPIYIPETGVIGARSVWLDEQSTSITALKPTETKMLTDINDIINCEHQVILIEHSVANDMIIPGFESYWDDLMRMVYNKYFKLNKKWQLIYDNLPIFDWGIAIRRGEHLIFNPQINVSIATTVSDINNLVGSKYVTSDDLNYLDAVCDLANIPIIYKSRYVEIDDAITQFLILSKCKNVLSTSTSSFGEEAAKFRNSKYHTLNIK